MRVRRLMVLILLVLALCPSCQPLAQTGGPRTEAFMVPMRDGVKLNTIAAFPQGAGPWPVVLTRTPYGAKAAMGDAADLTRNGVVRINQDLRGRYDSEGQDAIFLNEGWGEHQDGYDTIEWIAKQPWCNGKVGMMGGSAGAITQYLAAGTGPEALKCCLPVVGCASLYEHCAYVGGEYRQNDVDTWMRECKFSAAAQAQITGNPAYNDLWRTVDLTTRPEKVRVPMLHAGGWYDMFTQGTLDAFVALQHKGGEGAKGRQVLEIGPWTHSMQPLGELEFPESAKQRPAQSRAHLWAGHYLLGLPDPFADEKPVWYYTMGACDEEGAPGNEWHNVADWPVPSTPTPLYLRADGSASLSEPKEEGAARAYDYDPANPVPTIGGGNLTLPAGPMDQRKAEERKGVLLFTTAALEKAVEVTGRVKARLFVASDCKDTDFTVKLTDVYPDGRSMLVCDGILQMRRRGGLDKEEFMEAGQVYEVSVDLWSTSIVFNAGHRIRVAVSSSNCPRFAANPNTGAKFRADKATRVAKNTVYLGKGQASCLVLPVVE
jgi:uncharacterized protein